MCKLYTYTFIKFTSFFHPTLLFGPTLVFGTLEYAKYRMAVQKCLNLCGIAYERYKTLLISLKTYSENMILSNH